MLFNYLKNIYKSKTVSSVLMISVVIGAFITIGGFIKNSYHYYYENLNISRNISDRLTDVSTGQSVNHFKQIFGNELTSRELPEDRKELIFKYKTSYIQTIINNDNSVIFLSVTDCENPIKITRPVFNSAYSNDARTFPKSIVLNRTTFKDIFGQTKSDIEFFLSGATSNSYYYESVYLGNPSNYQTLFVGVNDLCSSNFDTCMLSGGKCSDEEIANYRQSTPITTYGESAPLKGDVIIKLLKEWKNGLDLYLGPDRVQFRVFN